MSRTLRARSFDPHRSRRQRGVSLVGLMVGMTIGLFALLVIVQVLGNSQLQRRATMGAADAQQTGSLAMWRLSRELRMAGAGLQNAPFAWGCQLNVSRGGATLLPRSAFPAPFGTVPGNLRLQPVMVRDGGGGVSDLLIAMGARPAASNVPMPVSVASSSAVGTGSTVGFAAGDLLLVSSINSVDDCFMGQVDATYVAAAGQAAPTTVPTGQAASPFNSSSGFSALPSGRDWLLLNLGAAPALSMFAVAPGTGLMQMDLLQPTAAAPVALAESVVNMQVLLGVDDGAGGGTADDNVIDEWVDASAAPWDFATTSGPASAASQLRVKALRVALVVRSAERGGAQSPASLTLFADLPARQVVVPIAAADRAYKYQVYDSVIPLREQWMALCSEHRRAQGIPKAGACG